MALFRVVHNVLMTLRLKKGCVSPDILSVQMLLDIRKMANESLHARVWIMKEKLRRLSPEAQKSDWHGLAVAKDKMMNAVAS